MEKRTIIIIGIITIAIIAVLIYTNSLLVIPALILGFIFPDSYQVDLIEINSNLVDVENRTLINLSEEEFMKYPELRELFHNVTPTGEDEFNGKKTIFVNHIGVRPDKAEEIQIEFSPGTIYWKGGYYGILVAQP
jgi:hypothetical protein